MLYVSTRNNSDAYTAQRVLHDGRGPDGGLFVPFRLPRLLQQEVWNLADQSFNICVAHTLNQLFHTQLTGYDIDLSLGRLPVRLLHLNQRIVLAECWHNLQWQFSRMEDCLTELVRRDSRDTPCEGAWEAVGIRMAVLFGIFGELLRCDEMILEKKIDISMVAGDFSGVMAAWYARSMGLPIGNIVCCCNANGNLWDFICHGQLRTDGIARTTLVPEGDVVVPVGLERLIHGTGGAEEANRFADCLHRGKTYYVEDRLLHHLRQGIYVTVSSDERILQTIPSAYATHGCLLAASSALAYAGLQDYRARTGESRKALVMTGKSPARDLETVAAVMDISPEKLKDYLK